MAYGKNSIVMPIDMKQEYSVYPIFHKIEYNHNQNVHDIIHNKPNRTGSLLPDMR
jgi:hypothetical protein